MQKTNNDLATFVERVAAQIERDYFKFNVLPFDVRCRMIDAMVPLWSRGDNARTAARKIADRFMIDA